jgi:D-arabinose 1-dehydrogenase-like Zn-dependent alcohol dehydrogenase
MTSRSHVGPAVRQRASRKRIPGETVSTHAGPADPRLMCFAGSGIEWHPGSGRTWAVQGAGGLGHLLAQQLVAAGELVLDVQPKLGARVRLLATGDSNKTTRTMPCRWPSRHCAPGPGGR